MSMYSPPSPRGLNDRYKRNFFFYFHGFLWIFIRIFPIAILSQPLNRQNLPTPPPAPKQMSDLLHSGSCWNNSIALSAGYTNVHIFQSIGEMARRGGAEVAGWTLDRKIRVRFPAYPHRVWALWWQGGKRRLRTYRCPCRGRLGTLKLPMAWVPGSRSKFGNWSSVPSLYSWNIAECDVKPQSTQLNIGEMIKNVDI